MNFKCVENVTFDIICKEVSNALICIRIVIKTFLTFHVQGKNGLGCSQFWCIGTTMMRIRYLKGPKDIRRIYGQNLHVSNYTNHIRKLTQNCLVLLLQSCQHPSIWRHLIPIALKGSVHLWAPRFATSP